MVNCHWNAETPINFKVRWQSNMGCNKTYGSWESACEKNKQQWQIILRIAVENWLEIGIGILMSKIVSAFT